MPLPDSESLMVAWARANPEITALVGSRVGTRLPKEPTFPYLTVFRVGGPPDGVEGGAIDEALLQWDCYGDKKTRVPDYAAASLLARTLVEQVEINEGGRVGTVGAILGMTVVNGPRRQEEPTTGWARYIVETQLLAAEIPA